MIKGFESHLGFCYFSKNFSTGKENYKIFHNFSSIFIRKMILGDTFAAELLF